MHMYAHLDKLRERALYCDTDSFIFVQDSESLLMQCSDALGDMTSELKEGEFISEFFRGGPKHYAYKLCNSMTGEVKTVCKVRGITLNYNSSQIVNFDAIKDFVLNRPANTLTLTVYTSKKIKRKRGEGVCIYNQRTRKYDL